MMNIVSGPKDVAHAILIRAVEPCFGTEILEERRNNKKGISLTNGPGKLCEAMGINRTFNGSNLCDKQGPLWVGKNPSQGDFKIIESPRVGIAYAEECAHYPWRFRIKGNPYTSLPHNISY